MKRLAIIALMLAQPAIAVTTHLSTTEIHQPDGPILTMKPHQIITQNYDVTPKPGNQTWTSIKTCLSTRESQSVTLTVTLTNTETNEIYYWHKHAGNDCNKETFDIPVHVFHPLRLTLTCAAYPLDTVKASANGAIAQYCRGWAIFSSQITTP
jgi:hypothetical protein